VIDLPFFLSRNDMPRLEFVKLSYAKAVSFETSRG